MNGQYSTHIPVMLAEAIEGLRVLPVGTYLDGTFGRGGHAQEALKRLGANGRLLLMDQDPAAITVAQQVFGHDARVAIKHDNFAELANWKETHEGLDGVLFDLGMSSPQLDDASRGFSFQTDAPLDMRMNPSTGVRLSEWLNNADECLIADVLWQYGEERMSRRIARSIVEERAKAAIVSTRQLAMLVEITIGRRELNKHPATRTFQALRILINDELNALDKGLQGALKRLRPGGRLVVISFHSLEDRRVKRFMREHSRAPAGQRSLPSIVQPAGALKLKIIGAAKFPGRDEIASNPRARSAVLRIAERLP